jgi:hypothetical protein
MHRACSCGKNLSVPTVLANICCAQVRWHLAGRNFSRLLARGNLTGWWMGTTKFHLIDLTSGPRRALRKKKGQKKRRSSVWTNHRSSGFETRRSHMWVLELEDSCLDDPIPNNNMPRATPKAMLKRKKLQVSVRKPQAPPPIDEHRQGIGAPDEEVPELNGCGTGAPSTQKKPKTK